MRKKIEKYSKIPSFKSTGLESPITEYALGIMAHKGDNYYASGTAIIIGKYLAITAQHVISDFFAKFEGKNLDEPADNHVAGSFHLQVFQILDNGKSGQVWNITRLWSCNYTDIAILRLTPITKSAQGYKWRPPKIDLIPPKVGDRVSAFGYRNPKIEKKDNEIRWIVDSKTSVGEVIEVHDQKRDTTRLSFPCFQTNARYDGAMSGGPVFNDSGRLCGIICSNLPPFDGSEEHVSYVTGLWPIMGTKIDMNRKGYPQNIKYPMLELARDGFIKAEGWDKVTLFYDEKGNIVKAGLKKA